MRTVFIRADGSKVIGTGHIFRTLVLAQELQWKGYKVVYLCRKLPGAPLLRIKKSGFAVIIIANVFPFGMELLQVRSLVEKYEPEWIIVDHYEAKENYYLALKGFGVKVMAIDDISKTRFPVDILFNQNINARDLKYKCSAKTRKLLGPHYALVGSVYPKLRERAQIRQKLNRILVFMGGADPDNQTLKVLRAVRLSRRKVKVDVVLGSAFAYVKDVEREVRKNKSDWSIHRDLPHLGNLMLKADLAIGAGGSVSWEMCTLKLPMILLPIADNQKGITHGLAKAKAAICPGDSMRVSEKKLAQAIANLTDKHLAVLSQSAGRVCDGLGAERVRGYF